MRGNSHARFLGGCGRVNRLHLPGAASDAPVHTKLQISLLLLLIAAAGCTTHADGPLERLPRFQQRQFRSEPYIRAAVALQAMGRQRACEQMMALAKRDRDAEQIFILCRMLFTKRGTSEFRRPMIGGAVFLADTGYSDWPLEPIELVDGVPFVITWGYILAGEPEPPESYLRYCMSDCDWSTFRYREQSRAEMRAALAKLVASSKWRRPLEQQERERLTEQIN